MNRTLCVLCFYVCFIVVYGQFDFFYPQGRPRNPYEERRNYNYQNYYPRNERRYSDYYQRPQNGFNQYPYPNYDESAYANQPRYDNRYPGTNSYNQNFRNYEQSIPFPVSFENGDQVLVFEIDNKKPKSEDVVTADRNGNIEIPSSVSITENEKNEPSNTQLENISGNTPSNDNPDIDKNLESNKDEVETPDDPPPSSEVHFGSPGDTFNSKTEETSTTGLPELTPVPNTGSRSSFSGGGIFKETCPTATGGVGSCIVLVACESLYSRLRANPSDGAVVRELRAAHCGFEGNNPKVCCPLAGVPVEPPTESPPPPATSPPTEAPPISEPVQASLPEPPECGFSNASLSRVVGGVPAKLGDFPWMALLGYRPRQADAGPRWLCGGSLVSRRHVLTAAHCIHKHERDLYLVRVGDLDISRDDDGATPVDVPIAEAIKHEDYSPTAFTNDIGLLVLQRDVGYTPLIRPICLPAEAELRARSFEDYNPIIAGWGDTEFRGPAAPHLQALQLPVVSNEFCASAYSAYKNQQIDERVLCAGYKRGGRDACQGDSGGPLMQPIWNPQTFQTYFYQIGVVSFGKKCAEPGFPGVYTRVTYFVPWLQTKITGGTA